MSTEAERRPRLRGRITVVGNVYLQQPNDDATCVETRFVRHLRSDDQPYRRRVTVTREWAPLETGWLGGSNLGMLVLANEEGTDLQKVPTRSEREDIDSRVVEVGVAGPGRDGRESVLPFLLLPVGEDARFFPYDVKALRLRCQNGEARCLVNALPI